jgi:ubiquinone/menaquinone biosynthesis C-methylase UbiE
MTADTDKLIDNLERMNALREAPLRAAIAALHFPPGSRGLDIGCGTGDPALMMAEATDPDGCVIGLDISWPVLNYARRKAGRSAVVDRIAFEQGDMCALPFAQGSFDWAWSVDCVGYPSAVLLPILMDIRRVVRPGGIIALLAWSSQQLLPGYSMLEARLNATCTAYAPFLESQPPQAHFQRALHSFAQAGLTHATCNTFVGHVQAPLRPEIRDGMALLFEMLWGNGIGQGSQADREAYRRLCSPNSPDFIVDLPEYCGFFTYTMFTGRVAALS